MQTAHGLEGICCETVIESDYRSEGSVFESRRGHISPTLEIVTNLQVIN